MAQNPEQYLAWEKSCQHANTYDSSMYQRRMEACWKEKIPAEDHVVYSSSGDSEDSPIMPHRYNRYRTLSPYGPAVRVDLRRKRFTITKLEKLTFFCTSMMLFCVLLYIPVYNKANDQIDTKGVVAGWYVHSNRDTKIYVQPNNVTTLHEPKHICPPQGDGKLFLLVVVCSSIENFKQRLAIRESWGSYVNYMRMTKLFDEVKLKYKKYNYTYNLYPMDADNNTNGDNKIRNRRHLSYGRLLPELAVALKKNLETHSEDPKRSEAVTLPEFDMNDVLNGEPDYYDSNVMRVPPNGEEGPDLETILRVLKNRNPFEDNANTSERHHEEDVPKIDYVENDRLFKVVYLLGLPGPSQGNDTSLQDAIDKEVEEYGDVIQENFVDSYNNLTLKSIMMLKWIVNHCSDTVRYIMKTDDDMFVTMPNLITTLRDKAREYDRKGAARGNERLLIGELIRGARPVTDVENKWYSPRYMYNGRVYPRYLSGSGYALSLDAAQALYKVALNTPYFHLEDVYITGLCAARARIRALGAAGFSGAAAAGAACAVCARVTAHRVPRDAFAALARLLRRRDVLDRCERIRLTQVRKKRLRPKSSAKKGGGAPSHRVRH